MIYIVIYNSLDAAGGVERVAANILKNLPHNFETSKITVLCTDNKLERHFYYNKFKCVNIYVHKFKILEKIFRLSRIIYSFKILFFILRNIKDNDIVHFHGYEYTFATRIFRSIIKRKFTLLVTIHGSFYDAHTKYTVQNLPNRFIPVKILFYFFRFYFFIIERFFANNIDYYVFITEYLKDFYFKTYKINRRYSIINNGLYLNSRKYKINYGIDETVRFVIVGSSFYGKGLDVALESIKRLYNKGFNVELNIIGFHSDKRRIEKHDSKYIKYFGQVDSGLVSMILSECDILVFPSRNEGFPLAILESISCGLPVIVSKDSKFSELNDNQMMGIIVRDYKIDNWVDCMKFMINNIDYYKNNIKNYDFSRYLWLGVSKKYLDIYINFHENN